MHLNKHHVYTGLTNFQIHNRFKPHIMRMSAEGAVRTQSSTPKIDNA